MPLREWRTRVEDILDAIRAASKYVEGMSFESFANVPALQKMLVDDE